LPLGNRAELALKHSISRTIISFCVSLRSYMLDTAVFSAEAGQGLRGRQRQTEERRQVPCIAPLDRLGELP
jgi:hypothetical protein